MEIVALEPNRARQLAKELGLQVTLKRVAASSIEQVDDARFNLFTKLLWKGIYEDVATESAGYTVLLVPSYFDFVRLKSYMKRKNAQVAMVSEYTDKKQAQRLRTMYEQKELPVLMITERALVFQKLRVRFCRNLVLYAVPESPDIIEAIPEFMQLKMWDKIQEHRLR